jgi:hypothetical protein
MRQITIAFAAVAITALFVAPVSAEKLEGGPLKQHGQCWTKHSVGSDMSWGVWSACPAPTAAPAAAPATRATTRRRT